MKITSSLKLLRCIVKSEPFPTTDPTSVASNSVAFVCTPSAPTSTPHSKCVAMVKSARYSESFPTVDPRSVASDIVTLVCTVSVGRGWFEGNPAMPSLNLEFGGMMCMGDIASHERMMICSTEPVPPPTPNVVSARVAGTVTTLDTHRQTIAVPAIGPAVAIASVEERSVLFGIKEDKFCPPDINTVTSIMTSVRPVPAATHHRTPAVVVASMVTHWPHAMAPASMINRVSVDHTRHLHLVQIPASIPVSPTVSFAPRAQGVSSFMMACPTVAVPTLLQCPFVMCSASIEVNFVHSSMAKAA